MKLARTIRFDDSDLNVFERPALSDEWAVSGAFEFANWDEGHLAGKARQAFANGWLGLESFGRSTFVAVAEISEVELAVATAALARHFVSAYGAPSLEAAMPVAEEEIGFMRSLCEEHDANTLIAVERQLTDLGLKEGFRAIRPQAASLEAFAVHVEEG